VVAKSAREGWIVGAVKMLWQPIRSQSNGLLDLRETSNVFRQQHGLKPLRLVEDGAKCIGQIRQVAIGGL